MESITNKSLNDVMTTNIVTSHPNMIMTEVSKIFEQHSFHHLPVLDDDGQCLGIISKLDYFQLQDRLTKINNKNAQKAKNSVVLNDRFFRTLIAADVMSKNPICLDVNETANKAINIFLENRVHCVVATKKGKCVGVVTPFDILKQIKKSEMTIEV